MFANDKSIDNLEALFKEIKKYTNSTGNDSSVLFLVHAGLHY